MICGHGGIGRRVRLRGVWETIRVQVPVTAPNFYFCAVCVDIPQNFYNKLNKTTEECFHRTHCIPK